MQQTTSSPHKGNRFLVISDNKSDVRSFSGSSYHLALEGVKNGLLTGMVNSYPRGMADWRVYARRGIWRLCGGLHRRYGLRYTEGYADAIWKRNIRRPAAKVDYQ